MWSALAWVFIYAYSPFIGLFARICLCERDFFVLAWESLPSKRQNSQNLYSLPFKRALR